MPIRKGDGVSLAPKGIQEVRKGDGTVIYSASSGAIVDDFEDGDISEYSGDTAGFATQQTTVQSGSYALTYTTVDGSGQIYSTSGLNQYPAQGDTLSIWLHAASGSGYTQFMWGVQDGNNFYLGEINPATDDIKLFIQSGGSFTSLASKSVVLSPDVWYEVRVDWGTDGTMTLTVYDSGGSVVDSITGTDTSYSAGGVGMRGAEDRYWDNYTIL